MSKCWCGVEHEPHCRHMQTASGYEDCREIVNLWGDILRVGQRVSRDGIDEHEIVRIIAEDMIEVRCTMAPPDHYCKVGDGEENLARRYRPREIDSECADVPFRLPQMDE